MELTICRKCSARFVDEAEAALHVREYHPGADVAASLVEKDMPQWYEILSFLIAIMVRLDSKPSWQKMRLIASKYGLKVAVPPIGIQDGGFFRPERLITAEKGKEYVFWHELGHATWLLDSLSLFLLREFLVTLKGYLLDFRWRLVTVPDSQ